MCEINFIFSGNGGELHRREDYEELVRELPFVKDVLKSESISRSLVRARIRLDDSQIIGNENQPKSLKKMKTEEMLLYLRGLVKRFHPELASNIRDIQLADDTL